MLLWRAVAHEWVTAFFFVGVEVKDLSELAAQCGGVLILLKLNFHRTVS
jgi:hypothetical protein